MSQVEELAISDDVCPRCCGTRMFRPAQGDAAPCLDCNATGRLSVAYRRLQKLYDKLLERSAVLEDMLVAGKVRLNDRNRHRVETIQYRINFLERKIAQDPERSNFSTQEASALKFAMEVIAGCGEKPVWTGERGRR